MKFKSEIVKTELLEDPSEILIISEELFCPFISRVKLELPERLPMEIVSKVVFLRSRVLELVLRVPEMEVLSEADTEEDWRTVIPEPPIFLVILPERLKVELLVTEPANLSREEERVPEETVTSLEIEPPEPMETSP